MSCMFIIKMPKSYGMLGRYGYIIARLYTPPPILGISQISIFTYKTGVGANFFAVFFENICSLLPAFQGRTVFRLGIRVMS